MTHPDIDRLLDTARIRLPGAVDAALMIELFATMKDFFIKTNAWRDHIEFSALPDQREYDIFPAQGTIVRMFGITDEDDRPVASGMSVPGSVVLRRAPLTPATYTAEVSLTVVDPTGDGEQPQMPLWAANRYFTTLLDGLVGRMMSQPAKPYSSPQTAVLHIRRYESGTAKARSEVLREHRFNAVRWRFPPFGN